MAVVIGLVVGVCIIGSIVFLLLRWYLAPDIGALARLQSERYSLFEVARAELGALASSADGRRLRESQLTKVREQHRLHPDKHAAEFIARKSTEELRGAESASAPLAFPLLSKAQQLYVVTDIDLMKWVLNDPVTFDRARTLESFADAFRLNSVFTTKDLTLNRELRGFFTRKTNNLPADEYRSMHSTIERCVDSMLSRFGEEERVAFIPKLEGMVLEAYAAAFFGLEDFPDAEECAILIKEVWQLKSLRNNVPYRRWNPWLWLRMRRKQRRLFRIIDQAQRRLDASERAAGASPAAAGCPFKAVMTAASEMAQVYGANGYARGNLLNALIPLYEAIARGLVYAVIELANAPALQEQLYEEIVQNKSDELEYCSSTKTLLHRVWVESLRLRPPTPNQTRRVTVRTNPLFPWGSKVVIIWSIFHLDERVWGADAAKFRPDRWLSATREQEQYNNPFGAGVQKCVAKNYAGFGGRVMLKRLVESTTIRNDAAAGVDGLGTDRGYSRGPDPETSWLQFTSRTPNAEESETLALTSI